MSRITGKAAARQTTAEKQHDVVLPPQDIEIEHGTPEHIIEVLELLDGVYRNSELPADGLATGEPLDGLILTLLSQNTNDRNRDAAYERLRAACPAWSDAARLAPSEIADLIRPAGLGDTKAERMIAMLAKIKEDLGEHSLKKLLGQSSDEVREYLLSFDGIGPKTAACVMVFDMMIPAFPVDTHVARLSRRLGWADRKASAEKIQIFLEHTVPDELCRAGHLNMIAHGRSVCSARRPACERCPIIGCCPRLL